MRPSSVPARLVLALLAALPTAACAPDEPAVDTAATPGASAAAPAPTQLDLTRGYRPRRNRGLEEPRSVAVPRFGPQGVDRMELVAVGDDARLVFELERDGWREAPGAEGLWRANFGLRGYPVDDTAHYELVADGQPVPSAPAPAKASEITPTEGSFCAAARAVFLDASNGPPEQARLAYSARRGREEDGRWMVEGRRFSGAALPLWSGERVECAVPGPGLLRFAIAGESAFSQLLTDEASSTATFRIALDGTTLFEQDLVVPTDGAYRRCTLDLGAHLDGPATLELSVAGEFAYTGFFAPRWSAQGAETRSPEEQERPNLLVFQADTFRADNLIAYGGEHALAPYLEELAAGSLCYTNARSVTTYTLPAHATMFSGLFPHQAGMGNDDRRLSDAFDTLPERLAAAGYRTGAITEASYVSSSRGFAQGFEWFDELRRDMAFTQERVEDFLDADDGRPWFLFVQTYAIHTPYDVRDETREAWGETFDLEVRFEDVFAQVHSFPKDKRAMSPEQLAAFRDLVRKMDGLYRAGVVDFGADFARLHRRLLERGALEGAWFVFTSDHGEAFLEHDNIMHKGPVFEEQTRIPLLVSGPGVEPGRDPAPVSLIDFAPSLAAWAGIEAPAEWVGLPFERVPADRPVYLFECYDPPNATWAKIEADGRKVIGYEHATRRGEIHRAYDLAEDPGEREDLAGEADWPRAFLERMGREAEALLLPVRGTENAAVDAERLEELRALGYAGGDEER